MFTLDCLSVIQKDLSANLFREGFLATTFQEGLIIPQQRLKEAVGCGCSPRTVY